MEAKSKIQDVGEHLPYAQKHGRNRGGIHSSDSTVSLKELWPEPDWESLILNGVEEYAVAHLAMIYRSFRVKPRTMGRYWLNINSKQWEQAYIDGLSIMRELYESCTEFDDVELLQDNFAKRLGFENAKSLIKSDIEKCLPFWAIGRGERTLKNPTSLGGLGKYIADYLPDLDWPYSDIALKVGRFPIEFTSGRYGVCWKEGKSIHYRNSEIFDTIDEALDCIRELHKKELDKQEKPEYKVPKKPSCKDVNRTGVVHRDKDIAADKIINDFHFRGVQFGASMGEKEKQRWINSIYDSLCDLSIVLNIPKKWLGLKGLGIAFGARGRGNALAHFEPGLRIINLTREKGASSLGHEWLHGLDDRLKNSMNGNCMFASHAVLRGFSAKSSAMKSIAESLNAIMVVLTNRQTEYFKRSQRIESIKGARKYWTEPHELFARAFEGFLQDALEKNNIINPWLVFGTRTDDYHCYEEKTFPYPLTSERELINELFVTFFNELAKLK